MPTHVDVYIGRKIREARLLTKSPQSDLMTQTELGEVVGVSFQQIQKYENGTNRISGSRLWQIAEALNRPINFFFEDVAEKKKEPSISDNAIITAKMFHELPDGDVKKQVYKLIKSFHSLKAVK